MGMVMGLGLGLGWDGDEPIWYTLIPGPCNLTTLRSVRLSLSLSLALSTLVLPPPMRADLDHDELASRPPAKKPSCHARGPRCVGALPATPDETCRSGRRAKPWAPMQGGRGAKKGRLLPMCLLAVKLFLAQSFPRSVSSQALPGW